MKFIYLLLILSCFYKSVFSLYFTVPQGGERCFFEHVPEKALLSVSYELFSDEGRECIISISDNDKKVLKNQKLDRDLAHTRMSFVSPETNTYNVCVHCPGRMWYMNQVCKISLNFEIADVSSNNGELSNYDVNYETTAKKEQVDTLNTHLNHFIASANVIQEYQISENHTSTRLYDNYKTMNTWILVFYLIEILIVVVTSVFSIYHITRFFKTQCII